MLFLKTMFKNTLFDLVNNLKKIPNSNMTQRAKANTQQM